MSSRQSDVLPSTSTSIPSTENVKEQPGASPQKVLYISIKIISLNLKLF